MSEAGRKRILTGQKQREVCLLISAGAGIRRAARSVGCSVSTIRREARENGDFAAKLRQAELEAQLIPLELVQRASMNHWRAAVWLLEHAERDRGGRPSKAAIGRRQARQFARELSLIVKEEVADAVVRDRLELRLMSAIQAATV